MIEVGKVKKAKDRFSNIDIVKRFDVCGQTKHS